MTSQLTLLPAWTLETLQAEVRSPEASPPSRMGCRFSCHVKPRRRSDHRHLARWPEASQHTGETGPSLTNLIQHSQADCFKQVVRALCACSGALVAAAGNDGVVRLWDTATGRHSLAPSVPCKKHQANNGQSGQYRRRIGRMFCPYLSQPSAQARLWLSGR